jgi:hypothetical protein
MDILKIENALFFDYILLKSSLQSHEYPFVALEAFTSVK